MKKNAESVLLISQYFPPETGAAPTRWSELTERWANEVPVTVITSAPDYPEGEIYDGYENSWIHKETHGDVEVFYTKTIPSSSGNLLRRALKFAWFMLLSFVVALRYTNPSVVIATSPQPLTGVSAWLVAKLKHARFVFEVRDLWPESIVAVSSFDNSVVLWLLDNAVEFLYGRADRIVVVSRAFIDPIVDTGVNPEKIRYHPNGIDPDFYTADGEPPAIVDVFDGRFAVSYVGTIGRAHGLSVVIEAAQQLPDVQFVLVGDGAERDVLVEAAEEVENLILPGRCEKSDVPHVLAASDVSLVHLKPRDVFKTVIPSKMLEAMAAGLPIVLGVKGEAERILTEAEAGIVFTPGDPDELVDAIERLKRDDDWRNELATNCREYATAEFGWDTIAADYLGTITEPSPTVGTA